MLPSLCSLYHSYAGVNYSNLDVAAELARESEMAEAVEVKINYGKGEDMLKVEEVEEGYRVGEGSEFWREREELLIDANYHFD